MTSVWAKTDSMMSFLMAPCEYLEHGEYSTALITFV